MNIVMYGEGEKGILGKENGYCRWGFVCGIQSYGDENGKGVQCLVVAQSGIGGMVEFSIGLFLWS